MTCSEECKAQQLNLQCSNPSSFIRSQWPVSYKVFLCWRIFWLVWNFFWTCVSIRNEILNGIGEKWLIYLTNISYLMLVIHSVTFFLIVWYFKNVSSNRQPVNTRWYHSALWLLTTVSFDVAVAVSILYWTLEFKGVLRVQSFMTHSVNSMYVIFDLAVISVPVRLVHVIYSILYSTAYLVFTICYHLLGGTNSDGEPYIYRALNWNNTKSSAIISAIVLFVLMPLIHFFQFVCFTCRKYVHGRLCDQVDMTDIKIDDEPKQISSLV